jgi:hypothetical protein
MSHLDSNQLLPVSSTTITPTLILLKDPSFNRKRMVPEVGPDEPPTQLVANQTLHFQTSYASKSQTTTPSIPSTKRQQSLRERAESMRGGISTLEGVLLNENVPEEQRWAAQAELQQLRLMLAILSCIEQSDWARGLIDKLPLAYNILLS